MKFLGLTIDREGVRLGSLRVYTTAVAKAAVGVTQVPSAAVGMGGGAWGLGSRSSIWGVIRESFSGAWQRNVTIDSTEGILAFSAVYACLDLIAKDISKLRPMLVQLTNGVWPEITNAAYSPVLRKPNAYQTRIQFFSAWITSKLIFGNTIILKERDGRGVVVAFHVLNWRLVRVLVGQEDGSVFYSISKDLLAGTESVTVPASEIIHDRGICLFHPLIGIPPIYACGMSASQGNRIQNNSAKFFENMSRPSGMLTAPEDIPDETAARLKAEFEANFSGANLGRLLVAGSNIKYEAMTIPAQQSQLIEQLKWTVQDVASCFHVPLHKIASDSGVKYANMAEMNQDYYNTTLSELIESIEVLLDEGLGLSGDGNQTMGVMFDTDTTLLRLDPVQRAAVNAARLKAGYLAPNEARATDNYLPVKGGEEPLQQQQYFPLSVLMDQPAPGTAPPAPAPVAPVADAANDPSASDAAAAKAVADMLANVKAMITTVEADQAKRAEEAERRRVEDESARAKTVELAAAETAAAEEKRIAAANALTAAEAALQEAASKLEAAQAIATARDAQVAEIEVLHVELDAANEALAKAEDELIAERRAAVAAREAERVAREAAEREEAESALEFAESLIANFAGHAD